MSSEQCPFCAIVAGDDPDVREVYRNEHVVAFFPTEPAVLGHVLVVRGDTWKTSGDCGPKNRLSSRPRCCSSGGFAFRVVAGGTGTSSSPTARPLLRRFGTFTHLVPRSSGRRDGADLAARDRLHGRQDVALRRESRGPVHSAAGTAGVVA